MHRIWNNFLQAINDVALVVTSVGLIAVAGTTSLYALDTSRPRVVEVEVTIPHQQGVQETKGDRLDRVATVWECCGDGEYELYRGEMFGYDEAVWFPEEEVPSDLKIALEAHIEAQQQLSTIASVGN